MVALAIPASALAVRIVEVIHVVSGLRPLVLFDMAVQYVIIVTLMIKFYNFYDDFKPVGNPDKDGIDVTEFMKKG